MPSTDSAIDTSTGRRTEPRKKASFPLIPQNATERRRDQLEKCAASFRLFSHWGFDEGLAGHISVRDPEYLDHFWVNPLGVHFGQMCVSDLQLVNSNGDIVQGNRMINQAAFAIHSQIHASRPDIHAAAHSHSMYGRAFSTLGKRLEPISQDACVFFERQGLHSNFGGVAFDLEEGERIAESLGNHDTLILQNHGLLTTGPNVDTMLWLYMAMERCCQAELLARSAGKPKTIPTSIARQTRDLLTTPQCAWGSAQPLFDWIMEKEPELLD